MGGKFRIKIPMIITECYAMVGKNDLALKLLAKTFYIQSHWLPNISNNQHFIIYAQINNF